MEFTGFLPSFQSGVLTIIAFVVALSVIVAIHEYGHYIVGRWSGIHAEVFSLGFGPVLFSRVDRRGTKWQLAAIPMGGFVRFKGDANAASGEDGEVISTLSEAELRQTMHGAPLWARTATVAAGPLFNFALSILIFAAVVLSQGVVGDKLIVGELRDLPTTGFTIQEGDEVLEVNGAAFPVDVEPDVADAFVEGLPSQATLDYLVRRDGDTLSVTGPHLYPPYVARVAPQSAAFATGLQEGDVITGINEQEIFAFRQLKDAVEGSDGATLQLDVWRDGATQPFDLTPKRVDEPLPGGGFQTQWRIGVGGGFAFAPATETAGIGEALGIAVQSTGNIIQGSISGIYHMVTGAISSCNLSGPIGIAQVSGAMASQGSMDFIRFIAVLSTAIGLLNLFPIPVLDGGHLVFYAYEAVSGRKPNDKVMRIMMSIGLALILSLMLFGISNDLFCP
ncbi:RIP metalloprotease RseP [Cognatishimia maritima]|uniref:Zinc metalloprotease n=1 Tax=Cognatishimia maritima TaxID=870908 RepID=A0A1M5I4V6_9RHOB|nr:RIP metalloprotease RseP [Cognatishimia maritima]SHG23292.1 regulator of sigma E protease [Cognatishimia maritima]